MTSHDSLWRTALRGIAGGLTVVLCVVGLAALTAPAATAQIQMASGTYEHRVQKWINVERAERGLRKLTLQTCTDISAERWARHLVAKDAFFHQDMGSLLNRCDAYYAGETLGRGWISPRHLVRLWMNSPPHRAVLLSQHARRIGVGAYKDSHGQWLTAANFTKF